MKEVTDKEGTVIGYAMDLFSQDLEDEKVRQAEAAITDERSLIPKGETEWPFEETPWMRVEAHGRSTVETCFSLAARKNADYASPEDPFKNMRRGGAYGIAIRMDDKLSRLLSLLDPGRTQPPQVNEKIEDTVKDLINYGWLLLALRNE